MGKNFMGYNNASELLTAIGNKIKAKYTKPNTGIPKSDLATAVQTSLGKADSAVQPSSLVQLDSENGGKNVLDSSYADTQTGSSINGVVFTKQADGSYKATGTPTDTARIYLTQANSALGFEDASKYSGMVFSCLTTRGSNTTYSADMIYYNDSITYISEQHDYGDPFLITIPEGATKLVIRITIYTGAGANIDLTFKPMIISKAAFDAGLIDFIPYSLSNVKLTNGLAEVVDSGAKNLLDLADAAIIDKNTSHTIRGNSITVTSSGTWAAAYTPITLPAGDYVFDFDVTSRTIDASTATPHVTIYTSTLLYDYLTSATISAAGHYTLSFRSTGATLYLAWYVNISGTSSSTNTMTIANQLLCTKAAFTVSRKFVPYAFPNETIAPELIEVVDSGAKNILKINQASNAAAPCFTSDLLNTVTINGTTAAQDTAIVFNLNYAANVNQFSNGEYVVSTPDDMTNLRFAVYETINGVNKRQATSSGEKSLVFTISGQSTQCWLRIETDWNKTFNNKKVRVMVCKKYKFDISPKYVPHLSYVAPAKHSNVSSIAAGGYVRIGNLVNVVIRCDIGSECSTYTQLFYGLPFPVSGLSAGANFVACASNQNVPIIICANGTIQNADTLPAMTGLLISATYICQ